MSTEGTVATTAGSTETDLELLEDLIPESAHRHPPGLLPGEIKAHPDPLQYVVVAVVLVVITGVEIGVSYLEGSIPNGLIITLLLVMAAVKFFLVASWYMHLRTDQPVFRRFFIIGSISAVLLYALVLLMLHVSFNF